jgi:hypothetical protein
MMTAGAEYNHWPRVIKWPALIVELAVLVLAKQGLAHGWKGALPEQPQPRLECVVEVNLAVAADDDDTAVAN